MNKSNIIKLLTYELTLLRKMILIEKRLSNIFSHNIILDGIIYNVADYEILMIVLDELNIISNDNITNKYYNLYNKKFKQKDIENFYNYLKRFK